MKYRGSNSKIEDERGRGKCCKAVRSSLQYIKVARNIQENVTERKQIEKANIAVFVCENKSMGALLYIQIAVLNLTPATC